MKGKVFLVTLVLLLLAAACAPSAPPTPTPTKAAPPPAAATSTAVPKVEPTKPAPPPATPTPAPPPATPTPAPPPKATGKPIKVGNMQPVSGPLATFGTMTLAAQELAIEDVNKGGGINGSPLELVTCDDQYDPRQTVTCMRKLVQEDKLPVIFGPFTGHLANVAFPMANELKVPVISQVIVAGMASEHRPWAFQSTLQADRFWQAGIEEFKKRNANAKTVTIATDVVDRSAQFVGKDLVPKLLAGAGLQLVGTVEFPMGQTDWSAIAAKIKEQKADAFILVANPVEGGGLSKELERIGYKPLLLLDPMHIFAMSFWSQPKWLDGAIIPYWVNFVKPDPKMQDFQARWRAKLVGKPGIPQGPPDTKVPLYASYDVNNYDAIMAVAQVMREAKITPDTPVEEARLKIRDGYQNLKDFPGVVGKITVSPRGDVEFPPGVLLYENGELKSLR